MDVFAFIFIICHDRKDVVCSLPLVESAYSMVVRRLSRLAPKREYAQNVPQLQLSGLQTLCCLQLRS